MGLSFLNWPQFVVVIIGCGIILFVYAFWKWAVLPKSATYGYILIGISSISIGLKRLAEERNILNNYIILFEGLKLLGILGIPFLFIGAYTKLKREGDVENLRLFSKILIVSLGLLIFFGTSVIYFYWKAHNY